MTRVVAALALFGAVGPAAPKAGRAAGTEEPAVEDGSGSDAGSEPEADADAEPDPDAASDADPDASADADDGSTRAVAPARAKFRAAPPPARDYDPDSGVPPGGYWEPGEAPEIAPKDGEEELLVAYILLPLATLTTVSGALNLWLTHPDHCPRRLRYVGLDATSGECQSLLVVNAIRTSYGAIGVITGAVLLGIGLHRKKQYELWKKRRFRASLGVRPTGASLHIRF